MTRLGSWKLPRRLLLGAGAVSIGLPLLEAMAPQRANAAQNTPRRMLFMLIPNGIHMQAWTPAQTGAAFTLTPILAPLEPVRQKVRVLSGLRNLPGKAEGAGDHSSGVASFLSCVHVPKATIKNGTSVDQAYAQHLGNVTPVPSLRLGMDGDTGYCGDGGYSCAYSRNISWVGSTPQSKLTDPAAAFDLLFSSGGSGSQAGSQPKDNSAEIAAIRARRKSVLDSAVQDATALQQKLGKSDRLKLQEYLDSVRALEMRIQNQASGGGGGGACTTGTRPKSPDAAEEKMRALMDIMVKAFQCDQTRVITFMTGNAVSGRDYGFIGASGNHHSISHHGGSQANYAKLQTINTWEIKQFTYLLTQMDASVEADGSTLLDNSMVYLSSEVSDGNKHNHDNLPVLLAGGGAGTLTGAKGHTEFRDQPMANLFLTMLKKYGVNASTFGDDSTGPLEI